MWRAKRYQDQPVYFSDLVVHQNSRFTSFADLRGATAAYNEPRSFSGYYALRYYLTILGETVDYFGRLVESGSHQRSLQFICEGQVDVAAIDSTVLEQALLDHPLYHEQLRTIGVIGPNVMPPWVASTHLPQAVRVHLRNLLIQMHQNEQGVAQLAGTSVARFAPVADQDYDPMRAMLRRAVGVYTAVGQDL